MPATELKDAHRMERMVRDARKGALFTMRPC